MPELLSNVNIDIVGLYLCAVAGSALLWAKSSIARKNAYGYLDVLAKVVPNEKIQSVVQFVIFISFGALVAIILTSPTTSAQALAGGMAWSRLTSAR